MPDRTDLSPTLPQPSNSPEEPRVLGRPVRPPIPEAHVQLPQPPAVGGGEPIAATPLNKAVATETVSAETVPVETVPTGPVPTAAPRRAAWLPVGLGIAALTGLLGLGGLLLTQRTPQVSSVVIPSNGTGQTLGGAAVPAGQLGAPTQPEHDSPPIEQPRPQAVKRRVTTQGSGQGSANQQANNLQNSNAQPSYVQASDPPVDNPQTVNSAVDTSPVQAAPLQAPPAQSSYTPPIQTQATSQGADKPPNPSAGNQEHSSASSPPTVSNALDTDTASNSATPPDSSPPTANQPTANQPTANQAVSSPPTASQPVSSAQTVTSPPASAAPAQAPERQETPQQATPQRAAHTLPASQPEIPATPLTLPSAAGQSDTGDKTGQPSSALPEDSTQAQGTLGQ